MSGPGRVLVFFPLILLLSALVHPVPSSSDLGEVSHMKLCRKKHTATAEGKRKYACMSDAMLQWFWRAGETQVNQRKVVV